MAFDTDHGEDEDREMAMFGVTFKIKQDRGSMSISSDSMIVGNTLWNSSVVLTRYLEAGAEGTAHEFSNSAVKGKSALELGAGCAGLVGLSLACLGCSHVTVTDKAEVLPLLRENVRRFVQAAQALPPGALPDDCAVRSGNITVSELDWLDEDQIRYQHSSGCRGVACGPAKRVFASPSTYMQLGRAHAALSGYDIVVGADISYATNFHAALLDATCAVSSPHWSHPPTRIPALSHMCVRAQALMP